MTGGEEGDGDGGGTQRREWGGGASKDGSSSSTGCLRVSIFAHPQITKKNAKSQSMGDDSVGQDEGKRRNIYDDMEMGLLNTQQGVLSSAFLPM